ncbi:MAG: dipeptide epimerase [Verrucomicrobiales bacterium]|nr:dipeptide epimerase [Verrucomicrobiales bacterium]
MKLTWRRFDLELRNRWTISRTQAAGPEAAGGCAIQPVVFVRLEAPDGTVGLGEASPCRRYQESEETVENFLRSVDPVRLDFDSLEDSLAAVRSLAPGNSAAKCALDIALVDGASRRAGQPVHAFLGLGFTEGRHATSFSIGIDTPERMAAKVAAASEYPILKIKLGSPDDEAALRAVREAAPGRRLRVDANEAWHDREEALRQIERLARDPDIEFVEQPMPAATPPGDLAWLKARSPLPLMADESYQQAGAVEGVTEGFHAVNVKLVKTGGLSGGLEALKAARAAGLQTMLGCMIESSLLITAAAHLADLTDYLDLDGNLLVGNDPYVGVSAGEGRLSLVDAPAGEGLRVRLRGGAGDGSSLP